MGSFDACITATQNETTLKFLYIKNVGTMNKAKRHANELAKSLELTPVTRRWKVLRTEYAQKSGLYGSWESEATRRYLNTENENVTIEILRA